MNVAIVGCGLIGQKRAKALSGARLVACADSNLQRAEQLARTVEGCITTVDWRRAIERDDVTAVIVATPHDSLAEITSAAVTAGKHVLVEKPAARSVAEIDRPPTVDLVARAKLPLDDLPDTQIVAFRASDDGQEHVALVIGAFGGAPALVRLHSECLTGDVFGSLKCDCGPQLKEALNRARKATMDGKPYLIYSLREDTLAAWTIADGSIQPLDLT